MSAGANAGAVAPPSRPKLLGPRQLDLFEHLLRAYQDGEAKSHAEVYEVLQASVALPAQAWTERVPIGQAGEPHNPLRRRLRWYHQTLKAAGILERVPEQRGVWRATEKGRRALTKAEPQRAMVAFSTELGVALWADCSAFQGWQDRVDLILSSPPFPLQRKRRYGGPEPHQYVEFVLRSLEPLVGQLSPGASVVLHLGHDLFEPNSPARTMHQAELMLALRRELGLQLMDQLCWVGSKPPGPTQWASRQRMQLNSAWEPLLWLSPNPRSVKADNRRVLLPHSDRQRRLIARGGEQRTAVYGDGAYRVKPGSFGGQTEGMIAKNVLRFGSRCPDQDRYRAYARVEGLPVHAASMPLALASFLVQWLTEPGDLVADPFGGTVTTGRAAEVNGRRWVVTENVLEYLLGGRGRFA